MFHPGDHGVNRSPDLTSSYLDAFPLSQWLESRREGRWPAALSLSVRPFHGSRVSLEIASSSHDGGNRLRRVFPRRYTGYSLVTVLYGMRLTASNAVLGYLAAVQRPEQAHYIPRRRMCVQ